MFYTYSNPDFRKVKVICEQENIRVMFNSISWAQYFSTIALLVVCYYGIITYRYYRLEILNLIGIKKVDDSVNSIQTLSGFKELLVTQNHDNYLPKSTLEIDISPLVQSFTDEVRAYLQEVVSIEIQKDALLNSLQIIASKYFALKDADCSDELEQVVLGQVNAQYPNLFKSTDIKRLWNRFEN